MNRNRRWRLARTTNKRRVNLFLLQKRVEKLEEEQANSVKAQTAIRQSLAELAENHENHLQANRHLKAQGSQVPLLRKLIQYFMPSR